MSAPKGVVSAIGNVASGAMGGVVNAVGLGNNTEEEVEAPGMWFTGDPHELKTHKFTDNISVYIKKAEVNFNPKPYTSYVVEVSDYTFRWNIGKRFREFDKLQQDLKHVPDYVNAMKSVKNSPSLPKKQILGGMDREFIKQRQKKLEKYLKMLCETKEALHADCFRNFLIPPTF
eukprot:UN30518